MASKRTTHTTQENTVALNPNAQPLGQKSEQKAKPKAGKALAVVKSTPQMDKLDTDLTKAKAAALTKKIQGGLESDTDLLHQALVGRVWIALGHKAWDDYIKAEFATAPLALPMEKRKPTVANLAERGWSTRAIAAVTGESQSTIARDAKAGLSQNDSVATDSEPTLDGEIEGGTSEVIDAEVVSEEPAERVVTGLDGKERTVTVKPVEKKEPVVVNIVSVAKTLAKELASLTVRFGALYDRDEYEENQVAVDGALQGAIDDFANELGDRLPEPEPAA